MAAVLSTASILILLVLLYLVFDRRRYFGTKSRGKSRPTSEVFRDPGSGRLMRVHEDLDTGHREYRPEE